MQNEDHALREALGFGGVHDASLNLQGALDDLRGRFDPKDGGVIAGTIERVIMQIEKVRAALSATPTPAPINNEALDQPTTIAFIREWMLSGDYPVSQWERDFAKAIDARAVLALEEAIGALERIANEDYDVADLANARATLAKLKEGRA